ncbi:MAG: hypothetical protein E7Z89_04435 [Cyanobacteria bacterium SIG28]|nr:hypothetical protein [Cyanobacteria bacterium SIG28]
MIYDCFTYFNEELLLELRLNYLDEIVDKFVIIEANKTFSGKPKGQNFDINKFKKFKDKIIYVFLEELPETQNPWVIESYQRNYIQEVLKRENAKDDDIVIVSDVDEIPSVRAIRCYKTCPMGINFFILKQYEYYLNLLNISQPEWIKVKIFQYKDFYKPIKLRHIDFYDMCMPYEYNKTNTATRIRITNFTLGICMGGWHFSWLGGAESIKNKLESFSHQEFNKEPFNNIEYIEDCLKLQKSVVGRNEQYKKVEIDDSFPKYLLDNLDKFKDYIL